MQEYLKAKNDLAKTVNKIVPEIQEYFANNIIQYKADYTPYAKHYEALKAILTKHTKRPVQAWFRFSEYSTWIEFRTNYQASTHCTAYISDSYFIDTVFNKRKIYTEAQILKTRARLAAVNDSLQQLRSEQSRLKHILDL